MKKILFSLLVVCGAAGSCIAQEAELPAVSPPFIIAQTGIGLQWFGDTYKLATFSLERPLGPYEHIGVQGNLYFKDRREMFYYSIEFLKGYEVGVFYKYFLHGRFSGHKSGLYVGPDLRFGSRHFRYAIDNQFPSPPLPTYVYYRENTTKVLLRWGLQWQIGHANLELSVPFGIEFFKSQAYAPTEGNVRKLKILPTLQMGFAL